MSRIDFFSRNSTDKGIRYFIEAKLKSREAFDKMGNISKVSQMDFDIDIALAELMRFGDKRQWHGSVEKIECHLNTG